MKTLEEIITNLQKKPEVDAVFIMGSQGEEALPYSDIDIAVILYEKTLSIKAVHTWIDNKFADIFFFDHIEINRVETSRTINANGLDGVFVNWLDRATIQFDKSGKTSALIQKKEEIKKRIKILSSEKDSFWQKVNYNFINNERYFESNNSLYQDSLEVRLLYSVSEIFTGYFVFRDMPWRGEKAAIKYLKDSDVNFYNVFIFYSKSATLVDKFKYYSEMFNLVFPEGFPSAWSTEGIYPQSNVETNLQGKVELEKFWEHLTEEG